tara:strand:- start:5127 stop:6179 length:1053 start_codon:yes stop_codon:yes gene_type:complete
MKLSRQFIFRPNTQPSLSHCSPIIHNSKKSLIKNIHSISVNNKPIIVQTPYVQFTLFDLNATFRCRTNNAYFKDLQSLINSIKSRTQDLYTDVIHWENLYQSREFFNINGRIHTDAVVYDSKKHDITKKYPLNSNAVCKVIFKFAHIDIEKINGEDGLFGKINFEILQIKTITCKNCISSFYTSNNPKCVLCSLKNMSHDELIHLLKIKHNLENNNARELSPKTEVEPIVNDTIPDSPYSKYFKMKKMKIPPPAISQRMKVEGVEDWIISLFESCDNPHQFLLSIKKQNATPPQINSVSLKDMVMGKSLLNAGSRKLKDVKTDSSKGMKISLALITDRLFGLRKTGLNLK